MKNSIARQFTAGSLIKFAIPTIVTMLVLALYSIVDSIFVSNFVGTNGLSAINIVFPVINLILALCIMLGTGGSAIIAAKMGDGREEESRQNFSLIMIVGVILGVIVTIAGLLTIKPLIYALGASDLLYQYCHDYLKVVLLFAPITMIQTLYQVLFVTAGKPIFGLVLTISAGLTNVLLDYVFVGVMGMGISGAAIATGIGQSIPAIVGTVYFFRTKNVMRFQKPKMDIKMLVKSCGNGSSEMVTNLSMGVTTILFNLVMMRYLGEDGVAAVTIILYSQFLMTSLFMGFSMGVAPVISYNYGNGNSSQLARIFRMCMIFIGISSIAVFAIAVLSASGIVSVFSPQGSKVYEIAMSGFALFSTSFIFAGCNIYASAFFTALSNGKISAIISFLRTFVFIVAGLLTMPLFMGVTGVWFAVPIAEALTLIVSIIYLSNQRNVYRYARSFA